MAVLINRQTGQAFEVADDEAQTAAASMDLTPATPEQIEWLQKQREYEAKPLADRALETGEAAVVGLMKSGRELGKLRLDDSGLATSLFPEQAPQVSGAIQQHQQERDAILAAPRTAEISERHPLAHALGVDAPALFISPGVGGIAGMALESVGVGALEEAVGSTDEGRDFDIGNAATIAAQDLAFSGLAHAATQVASRVGNLLFFGTGNTMANNVKRGLDETAGPVVPDDVRFDGPLLEAETRTRRTAAASSPGMPPGPERDEMLRRAAPDLNDQVKTQGGDMFDSTLDSAKKSASVAESDMVARRVDEMLPKTTPAQTSWSADATRKFDDTRNALDSVTDEAGAPYAQRARKVADDAIAAIDASADSSAWFRSASTAREQLDSLADEIASSGLPATHRASLIVDDARGFLGRTLTDRSLFGAAAEMHAGVHGVARDKIANAVRTAGGDLRSRLSEFVSADEASRATMRKPLEQAIEGFEELAQAHERFGTALPKTIESLRENAATLRRGLKLADDVQTAARSAPKAAPRPAAPAARKEPDFAHADTIADQIRQRAARAAKDVGMSAAQKAVDYASGPGRAVYDDAVSDALKGAIQAVGAIGGLAVMGPPGFVAGWLGARALGKKYAPQVGQQILDTAQRYVKQHGADTAGAALLATAALGDEGEDDDSNTLAASVGGLFFARRFAERALGTVGRGAKAAGKGVMKASEAVTGAVDAATGKAAEVVGKATYTAGRKVGEAIGSGVDAVAKVAADEDLVKGAIKSGVRDPKRWLVRNTRGRIADKAAEYFGPRISNAATQWLEKRHGKTAQEVVDDAVGETVEAARKDTALLEEHSAQSAAMVEDVGAQIRAALNETAEQKARALQAFPQRIGGDPHAQRQLLTSAVDELSAALGKVSDGSTAKVAIEFANAAKQAIINAPTAKDRFRIGMQLTETLVHHTAEAGDSEMAKVFGAYADKMWEAMGQREVWMGARELQREAKRAAKKRESIIAKISAGEKLGIASLVGAAAVDDEDTAAALAATGGMGALVGRGKLMGEAAEEVINPRHAATIPPKGKAMRAAGPIASKPERDVTPTNFYPNSNAARNEYGENMRPYREAQRADNLRAASLVDSIESSAPVLQTSQSARKLLESGGDPLAEEIGKQQGATPAAWYRGSDGVERYAKFHGDKVSALNEASTAEMYRDFGVETTHMSVVERPKRQPSAGDDDWGDLKDHEPPGGTPPVLMSEKLPDDWNTIDAFKPGQIDRAVMQGYVRGVPADIVTGNWDMGPNAGNLFSNGKSVVRLDVGEAGPKTLLNPIRKDRKQYQAANMWDRFVETVEQGDLGRVVESPSQLTRAANVSDLKEIKTDLLAGVRGIQDGIAKAGGPLEYARKRFAHLSSEDQSKLADSLSSRLDFVKRNIDKIAILTAAVGLAAMSDDESGAAMAGAGGLALLLRRPVFVSKAGAKMSLLEAAKELAQTAKANGVTGVGRYRISHQLFGETQAADLVTDTLKALDDSGFDISRLGAKEDLAAKYPKVGEPRSYVKPLDMRDMQDALERQFPTLRDRIERAEGDFDVRARKLDNQSHKKAAIAFSDWADKNSKPLRVDIRRAVETYAGNLDYKDINELARHGAGKLEKRFADDEIEAGNAASEADAKRGAKARIKDITKVGRDLSKVLDKAIADGLAVPGVAYRGVLMKPHEIAAIRSAKEVEARSFMSTTVDQRYADEFVNKKQAARDPGLTPIVFEVRQKTGVPVQEGEGELLLRPGTKFSVEIDGDTIRLIETDSPVTASKEFGKPKFSSLPWVAGGLLAIGALAASDDASASEPEEAPEPDARTIAANRILAIDQAATQRIKHTARVLAGLAEPPDPEGLTTHLARFGADYDDPRSAFEDRKEILRKADVSPALVYDVIGASMGDVASVSPELYQAAAARVLDNFRYLRENLPTEVKNSIVYPTGLPPSESAMRDWATQWSTTMDPESVFDDIDRGTVTHLQIETLQGAHPDIYQQMRTEILAEVGANFETVPTSTKMQLDILFGADGLAGPLFSSEAAAIIGAASQAAAQRKQPGPADSGGAEEMAAGPSGLEAIRSSVTNRGV